MALQEMIISYTQNDNQYEVRVAARGIDLFFQAASDPGMKKAEGEKIVDILRAIDLDKKKGMIAAILRLKNGVENDGPNGEPAYQTFNQQSQLELVRHKLNGKLNDGINGEPGHIVYMASEGRITDVVRYKNDKETKILTKDEIKSYEEQLNLRITLPPVVQELRGKIKLVVP